MRKIRTGDTVSVMKGKDRGRTGKVTKVIAKRPKYISKHWKKVPVEIFVIVEGLNQVKKHQKPNPKLNQPGGILVREAPMHISNVLLVNEASGKPERVGVKVLENGERARYFKNTGEMVLNVK